MSRIEITTCDKVSNLEALEAISAWIKSIRTEGYCSKKKIPTKKGGVVLVSEIRRDDMLTSTNCSFDVKLIEEE